MPLANVTIAGVHSPPKSIAVKFNGEQCDAKDVKFTYSSNGVVRISGLESATKEGVFNGKLEVKLEQYSCA